MIVTNRRVAKGLEGTLIREIAAELKRGEDADRKDLVIVLDETPYGKIGVTVVYQNFVNVPPSQRSGIVLEALHEVWSESEVSQVTFAIGLIPSEAVKLGIRARLDSV